jgi:hypothetical protein
VKREEQSGEEKRREEKRREKRGHMFKWTSLLFLPNVAICVEILIN